MARQRFSVSGARASSHVNFLVANAKVVEISLSIQVLLSLIISSAYQQCTLLIYISIPFGEHEFLRPESEVLCYHFSLSGKL